MAKKNISIDVGELLAITAATQKVTANVFEVIERVKAAKARGTKVTAAQVRVMVLKALGLPDDLPAGALEELVAVVIDALKD
jgi:hypothetical protein